MSREIVTLQFGNFANYIGAHWWNIQESGFNYSEVSQPSEINHDVLYREGVNQNKQTTFTPRLLLVDLNGSLKHLPREGELYGNCYKRSLSHSVEEELTIKKLKENVEWKDDDVEVVSEPVAEKHKFQHDVDNLNVDLEENDYNLVENVDSWADFLYARYHPRSVNIINQFKHEADKQTFDTYCCGVQLWASEQFEDEFCDKIRQYVEECDFLQGFQIIFDGYNGHAGLATKCLEHVSDEYGKATFAVPVYAPKNILYENADEAMTDSIRVVNSALGFCQLAEHSSLFIPLSTSERVWRQIGPARTMRNVQYKADNLYQTSAILASYLDTISIRYRLRNAPVSYSLAGFCSDLNNYGRKFAAAGFSMPFPLPGDMDLIDCLDQFEGELFTQLTPNCSIGNNYVIQTLAVRGILQNQLKRPRAEAQKQMRMAAYKCQNVSEMFQLFLQCRNHAGMAHVSAIESAQSTRIPFPNEIFMENINIDGFLTNLAKRSKYQKVQHIPTLATAQSSSELSNTLENLHREAKRIKIAKLHRFKAAGLEEDDYSTALENLLLFKDNYDDNFEL